MGFKELRIAMTKSIGEMDSISEVGKEYARVYNSREMSDTYSFTRAGMQNNRDRDEKALRELKSMNYELAVHTVGAAVHNVRVMRHFKYLFFLVAGMTIGGYMGCHHPPSNQ